MIPVTVPDLTPAQSAALLLVVDTYQTDPTGTGTHITPRAAINPRVLRSLTDAGLVWTGPGHVGPTQDGLARAGTAIGRAILATDWTSIRHVADRAALPATVFGELHRDRGRWYVAPTLSRLHGPYLTVLPTGYLCHYLSADCGGPFTPMAVPDDGTSSWHADGTALVCAHHRTMIIAVATAGTRSATTT